VADDFQGATGERMVRCGDADELVVTVV
jgi:hypothetical protein